MEPQDFSQLSTTTASSSLPGLGQPQSNLLTATSDSLQLPGTHSNYSGSFSDLMEAGMSDAMQVVEYSQSLHDNILGVFAGMTEVAGEVVESSQSLQDEVLDVFTGMTEVTTQIVEYNQFLLEGVLGSTPELEAPTTDPKSPTSPDHSDSPGEKEPVELSDDLPPGMYKKDTADIEDLVPELNAVLPDIVQAYSDSSTGFSPLISSGIDGEHSPDSLHYAGKAIDLSSWDSVDYIQKMAEDEITAIAEEIADSPLSPPDASGNLQADWDQNGDGSSDFDVIVEDLGGDNQHIHVEFDPAIPPSTPSPGTPPSTDYPGYDLVYNPAEPVGETEIDEHVKLWQQAMLDQRYFTRPEDVDGLYGPNSVEVAKKFQADHDLDPDGIVGKLTWEATFPQV